MGIRLLDEQRLAKVIPLRLEESKSVTDVDTPEPAALYHLIVLTFLLHVPSGSPDLCACCDRNWPCQQISLAFRLREGF